MPHITKQQIKQAIQLAGDQGRYQKCMIFLFTLMWIEISLFLIGPSYIYMNPTFRCHHIHNPLVLQDTACEMIQECTLIDHFTLTSDLHLYCDKQFQRSFIQVIFSIGAFAGLLIINLISDIISRKYAAILALAIANIGSVCVFLGGSYQSILLLILSQFFCGFGAYSLIPLGYTYFSDLCSDQYRQKGVVFVNSGWGLSIILLGVLYILETHWSIYLMYFLMIPFFVVSLVLAFFLIESPYVLIHKNNQKQALSTLITLCKFNNQHQNIPHIEHIFYQYISYNPHNEMMRQSPTIRGMFKVLSQGGYLKPVTILMVICAISTLHLYGVAYAMEIQGLGYGVNSIIAGFIILTSFLYLNFIIHRIPRKCGMASFYTILALLGFLFLLPKIKNNLLLTSLVLGVSRVASNIAYTLLACVQTEAFTVEIQSIAAALIQTFSVLGVLFGPLVVSLAQKINIDPIVLISILLNFATWPCLLLPETLDQSRDKEIQNSFRKQDRKMIKNNDIL